MGSHAPNSSYPPRFAAKRPDAGYTDLEHAVMEALAWDLADELPDLARQFQQSRLGQRRNSGFGLFTETDSDPTRALPIAGPTGDLGTVHAMVGSLRDPIAFKVRVRQGRLLGLLGDSYGQDTRTIDFGRVGFDQIFTVDERGQSIAFQPTVRRKREPEPVVPPRPAAPQPPRPAPSAASRPQSAAPTKTPEKAQARPTSPAPATTVTTKSVDAKADTLFDAVAADVHLSELTPSERLGLIAAVWAVPFALAAALVMVFDAPYAIFVLAYLAARYLQRPSGLAAVRRGLVAWRRALDEAKATR